MAKDRREELTKLCHGQWAHWMGHLFGRSFERDDGSVVIPAHYAASWKRQMGADYDELSEAEKRSDREMADQIIAVIDGTDGDIF